MPAPMHIAISAALLETLDGLMLGDGNLWGCRTRLTCNAMYRQSSVSRDWLDDVAAKFVASGYPVRVYFDRTHHWKNGRSSAVWYLQSASTPELTIQRQRWYNSDYDKCCPMDFVLTTEVLRQWYLGDGCMRHGEFALFCSEWFTRREIDWLISGLERAVGVGLVRAESRRFGWNIALTKIGTARLLDLIGPCQLPSLAHKFEWSGVKSTSRCIGGS